MIAADDLAELRIARQQAHERQAQHAEHDDLAERDLTAWLGNDMQQDAITAVYRLEEKVKASGNEDLLRTWRRLQTSDHFYYMCTKWFADGDVHSYFNPYGTPYDAYINYMNVLADFGLTLDAPLPAAGTPRG